MDIPLKYVNCKPNRHGKRRWYFRRKGFRQQRLPGKPGSKEFMAAYAKALSQEKRVAPTPSRHNRHSLAALCLEYERSSEFRTLAPLTQRETRYVFNKLAATYGEANVRDLHRKDILRWRDAMQDRPGAANKMLRVLKVLMGFAIARDYRPDNPVLHIKLMKLGEHRAWTDGELAQFEARWRLGSMERTAFALCLYTGQRRADVAALTFKSIVGGKITLTQGKTGEPVAINLHPDLQAALRAVHPRCEGSILTRKDGQPMNPVYFGHLMAKAIEAAGLPDACVLHGLRKSAAVALIDAGCTPHQAAAVTGHTTTRMLDFYAKRRDRVKLGEAAILKWGEAKKP